MPLSPDGAVDLVKTRMPEWQANHHEISWIDRWYRDDLNNSDLPTLPARVRGREYAEIRDRSRTPWLRKVVGSVAEMLYVEGYWRPDLDDDEPNRPWEIWQANGMDAAQLAVHSDALAHALAYVSVFPGMDPVTGDTMPEIEGMSSIDTVAFYRKPGRDLFPEDVLRAETIYGSNKMRWTLIDSEASYLIDGEADGSKLTYVDTVPHNLGFCPVVKFANRIDLKARAEGEVEPFIPLASRIDQDTFDRLVVQRFGAWRVRYATGMVEPDTDEEKAAATLHLQVGDFLMNSSPDAKFGTLEPTSLDGYIKAREADIEELAAVSSTPTHSLTGQMINLSAEALAAAESTLNRKVEQRKLMFGESWELVLRTAAHIDGDEAGATAYDAQVRWRDMESRSLAQVADALGKMAQMLNVPPAVLWERIPGVTQQDVERWRDIAADDDAVGQLLAELAEDLDAGDGDFA